MASSVSLWTEVKRGLSSLDMMLAQRGSGADACTAPVVEKSWAIRYYHNASLCLTDPANSANVLVKPCDNGNVTDPSASQLWTYYAGDETHVRLKDTQMCLQVGEVTR